MAKEVEIDEDLQKEIAAGVVDSPEMAAKITEAADTAATKAAELVMAKLDTPAKKDIEPEDGDGDPVDGDDDDEVDEGESKKALRKEFPKLYGKSASSFAKMSKERRFFHGIKALMQGDSETIKEINSVAGEMYAKAAVEKGQIELAEKAGYANDAVSADGGALVPDPEFNTTVYENLPKYGVVFADANVQTTDRTAVYALSLTGTIAFTNVAEAGAISGTKLTFNRALQQLVKYAAIIPATEELTEDSIVDYWQIVTNEIARNYAKTADIIAFTDPTMGILHQTGIITQPLINGGAGTNVIWDDLLTAEGKLEDGLDTSTYVWYMRRETYFRLAQIKASTAGTYLADSMLAGWAPNPNDPSTPWGTPIRFTRVLPKSVEVSSNGGFLVYGDLKNYNFYNKNGMQLTMLTEAAITDANGNSFNLATQDGLAMRCVVRLLGILPAGNASKFVVVGTGTVS